jgi:hypothetical protein
LPCFVPRRPTKRTEKVESLDDRLGEIRHVDDSGDGSRLACVSNEPFGRQLDVVAELERSFNLTDRANDEREQLGVGGVPVVT